MIAVQVLSLGLTPSEGEAFRLRSADATNRIAVLTNRFKSGRIDSRIMKNGNLVLAGVATVVVALCLIFSFIYLQGDSQDGPAEYDTDTLRTDVVAGDYYVVEMTSDVDAYLSSWRVVFSPSEYVDGDNEVYLPDGQYNVRLTVTNDEGIVREDFRI